MGRLVGGAALCLALVVISQARSEGLTTYIESAGATLRPRSNAGVAVEREGIRLKADVSLQAPNKQTQIVPNVSSAFTLGKNLDIETRLNLSEFNTRSDATLDTRLHFRSLGPFFDELEGRIWQSPDGLSRNLLRLGFYQILGSTSAGAPLTLTGRATFETSHGAASLTRRAVDTRRYGLETQVKGLTNSFVPGDGTLSLKLERTSGNRPESLSTVAYNQAWTMPNLTKLGFNLKFLRATYSPADDFEPSIDFTWRTDF
jgi:hypothetical protein